MKRITIGLEHPEMGKTRWTIWREPNCAFLVAGRKPRKGSAWIFADGEGYERIVEGNWLDLVAAVKRTAANYGLTLTSELS